jgi:hypothetical protein
MPEESTPSGFNPEEVEAIEWARSCVRGVRRNKNGEIKYFGVLLGLIDKLEDNCE